MQDDTLPQEASTSSNSDAMTVMSIDSNIKTHISSIARIKEEMKVQREMLDSALQNDPEYVEKAEAAKAATKEKSQAKQRVVKQPHAAVIADKLSAMRDETRELQDGLSYYLSEYRRLTGLSEFEDADGELGQIVTIARLVKKSSRE